MGAKGRPNRARMGLGQSAQASRPGPFRGQFGPPFLEREDVSTLSTWRRRHSQGESHSPERPSTSQREKRREIIREKDRSTRWKHHHDQRCYA
jgi:hypothetical protein